MEFKTFFNKIRPTLLLAGFVVSLFVVSYFNKDKSGLVSQALVSENIDAVSEVSSGIPVSFKIPIINVDSVVESVGLITNGEMDVPKDPDNVAWFSHGPRPGEIGSAVIDGHYGIKKGRSSVFDDLHKLKKGDKVYVEDDRGDTTSFIVREIKIYSPSANAVDVFSSNDGKAHLNLITCEGVWDKTIDGYTGRLVVFTDRE